VAHGLNLNQIFTSRAYLIIKGRASFKKTFVKIKKSKKANFVFIEEPNVSQMLPVLIFKILGKKFLWIQGFANPPTPNFPVRLLLAQADIIIVKSRLQQLKLKNLGIDKSKIRYQQ